MADHILKPMQWLLLVCLVLFSASISSAATPVLENDSLIISFNPDLAGISSIENKLTGQAIDFADEGFRLEITNGTVDGLLAVLTPEECRLLDSTADNERVEFVFEKAPFTVTVIYELDAEDDFATKQIRVRYGGFGAYSIRRCEMFDWGLDPVPPQAIPYYGKLGRTVSPGGDFDPDPLPGYTSTAFFMRYLDGGIFSCLTTDFVLMRQQEETGRCQLVCWPGRILDSNDEFVSERGIIGVYKRTGYFHEPVQAMSDMPKGIGGSNTDTRLDYGEIDAISAAVRKYIKPGVYFTGVNAWGLSVPFLILDATGVETLKAAIDTMRKVPSIDGLHFTHGLCGLAEKFRVLGLDTPPDPNPYMKAVYQYAEEKGTTLSMFLGVSNNHPMGKFEDEVLVTDRDLLVLEKNGQRDKNNIAVSDPYIEFVDKTVTTMIENYPIGGFTYDFFRLSQDYDMHHGYLPGRASLYPQYSNIIEINRHLRERFPNLMLRGQIGWTFLGPWLSENMSMCHNAGDHMPHNMRNFLDFHIDHQFANNIRLSNWLTNNCRMYPRHKMDSNSLHNGGVFRAWDYGAFEYCVLSQMATSAVFGMFHNLPDERNGESWRDEDLAFFDKWLKWHKAHYEYYLMETEMFGEPRLDGVDGYAYGNGKDSIMFLCNPTYQSHAVAVPIGTKTFLPEGPEYVVRELYPEERNRTGPSSGLFAHGSNFVVTVPPQTVMVFEVKPYDPKEWLLTGIGGTLRETRKGVEIEGAVGPTGTTRLVGIRPRATRKIAVTARINGKPLPLNHDGGLLIGKVRFKGEAIDPEITDWQATRVDDGVKIKAHFFVPEAARDVLESQKKAIAKDFDTPEYKSQAAWLGWDRFIIDIPVVPAEVNSDNMLASNLQSVDHLFQAEATLNGEFLGTTHLNFLGDLQKAKSRARWSGFFIDASSDIAYGSINALELSLADTTPDRCHGLYLPNLTRRKTDSLVALGPPDALEIEEVPSAADAYIPVPEVSEDGESVNLHLGLRLSAENESAMVPGKVIRVIGGEIQNLVVANVDEHWPQSGEAIMIYANGPDLFLDVAGNRDAALQLGSDDGGCRVTLGEIIDSWRAKKDPFDPLALALEWPEESARVQVQLTGERQSKVRIKEDL